MERYRADCSRLKAELDEMRVCLREAQDKEQAVGSLVSGLRRELNSIREQYSEDQQRANREKGSLMQQVIRLPVWEPLSSSLLTG
jgi:uncharacterized NAD(P)/FAD-binding protein YdhS